MRVQGFESTLLGAKCPRKARLQEESWFGGWGAQVYSLTVGCLCLIFSSLSLARDNTNIPQWQLFAGH